MPWRANLENKAIWFTPFCATSPIPHTYTHKKWKLQEQPVNLWYLPEDAGLTETRIDVCSEIAKILEYSFSLPLTIYDWLRHLYLRKAVKKDYWRKLTYKFWTLKELAVTFLENSMSLHDWIATGKENPCWWFLF